jgi:alkyl sulfatase BDS1-like metallo-beta-lactamase superfamily hydrolase
MSLDLFLDYVAVRLNGAKAGDRAITLVLTLPDLGDTRTVMVRNGALSYRDGAAGDAHAQITIDRANLDDVILGVAPLTDQIADGRASVEGDEQALHDFVALLDDFEFWFDIVTP